MYFSLERKISQSLFEEVVYMDLSEMTPSCPTLQGPSVVRGTGRRSARVPRVFIIGICLIVAVHFFYLDCFWHHISDLVGYQCELVNLFYLFPQSSLFLFFASE